MPDETVMEGGSLQITEPVRLQGHRVKIMLCLFIPLVTMIPTLPMLSSLRPPPIPLIPVPVLPGMVFPVSFPFPVSPVLP